jgi:sarcosine oxidase
MRTLAVQQLQAANVVLGAGSMGSAAAYHLARRGKPVVLIEQFALGHDRGSSHGAARITRHSYADPHYARLMPAAFAAWRTLEADGGQNLYLRTGGISFCPEGVDYVAHVAANLAAIGVPHRRMSGRELRSCFPLFAVPDQADAVFEPDAGMLAAARALALEVALARTLGGDRTQVFEQCPVRRVDLDADKPTVVTDTHRIVADRLIVTAGSWTRQLFPRFASVLKPTRQRVFYFRPAASPAFEPGRFPIFIYKGPRPLDDFYGMPAFLPGGGLGVKAARHGGPETDPNIEDRAISDEDRAVIRGFLGRWLPSLAEAAIDATETCLYTVAPDDHFRLGFLPGRSDVIVASPCSGHGFKFSCLIGAILADLALQGQTQYDITPWRLPEHP